MTTAIVIIFALVYLGMLLGRLPGLALDRTGMALLGGIAMLAVGAIDLDGAIAAVDGPSGLAPPAARGLTAPV